MKITLETSTLTNELFKLQGIVSSKSTLPILQNALLEADADGTLGLHATDLDISVSTQVYCNVETPGKVSLRARDLYDTVKNLRSGTVTLEREDNLWVHLSSGTVKARLVGMDPAEFPQLQEVDEVSFLELDTQRFVRMIDRTLFSVSSDEGRPNLTGALVRNADEGGLMMVSTDGHRLSMAWMSGEQSPVLQELADGVIVPRKGLAELRRTVDLAEAGLRFGIAGSNAVFCYGSTTMFVRLIDGTFPNFKQVVPKEQDERKALVDRDEMIGRVKFVSLFSNSKTHNICLQVEDGTCTISSQDPEKGECEEQIPVTYTGASVKAGYNFKYLLDVLGVIETDQVSLEIIDTLSPTILHEVGTEEGDGSLFIVMPMRL